MRRRSKPKPRVKHPRHREGGLSQFRSHVKTFGPLLKVLAHGHPQRRKTILKEASPQFVDFLSQLCYQVLYSPPKQSPFSSRIKTRLKSCLAKQASTLRAVARRQAPFKFKKDKLVKLGSGLGMLLSAVLPTLISLFK